MTFFVLGSANCIQTIAFKSHYDNEPFDQGIHLLIGEKEYLGKGLALPLLKAMVCMQFAEPNTKKVIHIHQWLSL